ASRAHMPDAAWSAGGGPSPSAAASVAATAAATTLPSGAPSVAPTPVPSPEAELNILNWTDYLADDVIKSFEAKYGTKVTQSFFSTTDEMYAKLGDDGRSEE